MIEIQDAAKRLVKLHGELKGAQRREMEALNEVSRIRSGIETLEKDLASHVGANIPEKAVSVGGDSIVLIQRESPDKTSVRVLELLWTPAAISSAPPSSPRRAGSWCPSGFSTRRRGDRW